MFFSKFWIQYFPSIFHPNKSIHLKPDPRLVVEIESLHCVDKVIHLILIL